MRTLIENIEAVLVEAFDSCGYDSSFAKVSLSNRPDLAEYQCNGALAAAKKYRKNPMEIAEILSGELKKSSMFSLSEAARPGFLNLRVSPDYLASYLNKLMASDHLGCEQTGAGRTIILDYGGANVAKPLHVGHLRSAIIGESTKRLLRFIGYDCIGDIHLGDWGLQMGLIIEETKVRHPELPYFDASFSGAYPSEAPFTISDLEDIYPTASKKSKEDEAFAEAAHLTTLRLQQGDPGYTALFNHILNVSIADLRKNYARLNVSFEVWKGESDAQAYIPELFRILEGQNLMYQSEGAMVVDVAEEGDSKELPPCIIKKSDGASLYATTDLATLIQRMKDYKPSEVLYIVDKRQSMHFTQVFRVARKAGIVPPETALTFLGFGTMNGKDGKPFKTRDGGVMRLEQLISDIDAAVYTRIRENEAIPEDEAAKTAELVGLAALKYGDLSNQATKDYVFDLDRFISFEGNTGPYILYTMVRIKSILSKYAEAHPDIDGGEGRMRPAQNDTEKELQLVLAKVNDVIASAAAEKAPHRLCQYAYEICDGFNRFYHETKILTEADAARQCGWIALLGFTLSVLSGIISILGFEAPDRM
jgi:arginyl-tRNA synthetase